MHPFTEEVGPTRTLPTSATALDFFLQIFDHDLMEYIVTTNLYASKRYGRRGDWLDLTVPEFQAFLGTMLLMEMPAFHCYWSTNHYLGVPHIVRSFPRERFIVYGGNCILKTIACNTTRTT